MCMVVALLSHQADGKRIALLVGVGSYPATSGWARLGSVEDVNMLKPTLVNAGFAVRTLIDKDATHDAILKAIANMKCGPGDVVLIHFSGHGQQMQDAMGDERDGLTETFVAYDAKARARDGYKGENHLTDDEIREALVPVRNKLGARGQLMVTFDACHSEDSSRGDDDDDLVERGTYEVFKPGKRIARKNKLSKNAATGIELSACASKQINKQYKYKPGKQCGSLSFLLNEGIKQQGKSINFSKLADYVTNPQNYKRVMQTPQTPKKDLIK